MIYLCYNVFDSANVTNWYEIKSRRLHSEILTCFIFVVSFSEKNHGFIQETTLQKNFVIVTEKLDGIDIDDIGNLEDSPRFVLIDEECENVIVINDGGELTRSKNQKKKSGVSK